MAFKGLKKDLNKNEEISEFVESAKGETSDTNKKDTKVLLTPIPLELHSRMRKYIKSDGKRYETQAHIVKEALSQWLDNKGY